MQLILQFPKGFCGPRFGRFPQTLQRDVGLLLKRVETRPAQVKRRTVRLLTEVAFKSVLHLGFQKGIGVFPSNESVKVEKVVTTGGVRNGAW